MTRWTRRDFLKNTGTFVASAAVLTNVRCGGDDGGSTPPGMYRFAQGVASGDPRPTSVVIWTRVEATATTADPNAAIALVVDVATDDAFTKIVVNQMVQAAAANDHTVRVIVTGLTAGTVYHYRFTAGGDTIAGRTRTAPAKDADVPVSFAWVSCQDYEAGIYNAYRQLITDDDARAEADKIQFVVHLGDFIYETIGEGYQQPLDENLMPVAVTNRDGTPRALAPFPSGGTTSAQTLADYRHLYRSYLADPDLQAARARWPFINTWDDHEFTNDAWQSQANYDNKATLDEPAQTRRVNGSQAWFEYVPSQLTGADGVPGVTNQAKDFAPATVTNAAFTDPNADNFVPEPNNVAAVGAITIYRSFRFGKNVELMMTDGRSYRSDHAIPEDLAFGRPQFFDPRNVIPAELVRVLDQGKTANGGSPPETVLGFQNPRKNSPPGTMLGAAQKAWLKDSLKRSDATWKIWGNPVILMRCLIEQAGLGLLFFDRVLDGDAWDGYNTERKEILGFLATEGVKNVVAISGDIHAHFAGLLFDDYDAAAPKTVGVELVAAGVSSNSEFSFFYDQAIALPPAIRDMLMPAVTFTPPGGGLPVENLNVLLTKGTTAALTYASTNDLSKALAAASPKLNQHLKYVDTNAQGYGLVTVTATAVTGTLVTVNHPVNAAALGVKRSAKFTIPKDNPAGMTGPEITGTKSVPYT